MTGWPWIAGGWLIACAGAAVCAWALWWDRSRGRRRCPRCWYDMGGGGGVSGLVCPECGHDARVERRLRRTRRRWGCVYGGVALLGAAFTLTRTPGVRRDGWTRVLPDAVWVRLLPFIDPEPDVLGAEWLSRTHWSVDPKDRWESLIVVHRSNLILCRRLRELRAGAPAGSSGVPAPIAAWAAQHLGRRPDVGRAYAEALVELVAAPGTEWVERSAAANAMGLVCEADVLARVLPIVYLLEPNEQARRQMCAALVRGTRGGDAAADALISMLAHADPEGRSTAAITLMYLGPSGGRALDALRRLAGEDPDEDVRMTAQNALVMHSQGPNR